MGRHAKVDLKHCQVQERWLPCRECNQYTCHKTLGHVSEQEDYEDGAPFTTWQDWLTVQCQGYRAISFCLETRCSEEEDYDADTGRFVPIVITQCFPSRMAGRPLLSATHLLPHGVKEVYRQTHQALCQDMRILAGIGIRAIIEAVCKEKTAEGRTLEAKIDSLVATGVVTQEGAAILHSLRFMGNGAAHEVKAHTEAELRTAFDVVEYLLRGVYILPAQAGGLPRRTPLSGEEIA